MEMPAETTLTPLEILYEHLDEEDTDAIRTFLTGLHPAELGALLESLPPGERRQVWELLPDELCGDALSYMGEEARAPLLKRLDEARLLSTAESMEPTDLAYMLDELPGDLGDTLMESLNHDLRRQLETALSYPEDSAGRITLNDAIRVRSDITLEVVLRYLRRHSTLPPHTDALMVVDDEGLYQGKLPLAAVLTNQPEVLVSEVMEPEADRVPVTMPDSEVALLFERRELVSVAVIDEAGLLVGRITIDEVIDIIRYNANHALMQMAGLQDDEDLFAPVWTSSRRRALWLGINLVTAFLAAWVIGLFEGTLEKIVALAVLMPIVASMGGIAGSQTLTLTIRGLALGQVGPTNIPWLSRKEIGVGLLNGLLWALVVGGVALAWFGDMGIAVVIAAAILINLLAAAMSGIAIPLLLNRFGADPALSGAVVLTTVTDVVGFLSFLGLATWFLL